MQQIPQSYQNHPRRVINLCRRQLGGTSAIRKFHSRKVNAAIANYAHCLASPAIADQGLLQDLRTQGVAVTSLEALGLGGTEQLRTQAKTVQGLLSQAQPSRSGSFLHTASPQLMAEHSGIWAWGLQLRLLHLIEAYLQLPVAYHGVYLRRDLPYNIVRRSRLWHTDMEDDHTLKVVVYLNDVDEEGGPFEYLPKPLNHWVIDQLHHRCGYIRHGAVENLINPCDWRSCTGAKGTVIIVDTGSLIHRGKVPKRDRYTLFYDYTSRLPRRPYYCKSSLPESELESATTGLSQYQRNCVFWKGSSWLHAV